jgi:cell wall-associated NlpC family hydrolase
MGPDDARSLELIRRAHELFGGPGGAPQVHAPDTEGFSQRLEANAAAQSGGGHRQYVADLDAGRARLGAAAGIDEQLRAAVQAVAASHREGARATRVVLDSALADRGAATDTPLGRREAAARMAAHLRAQHAKVSTARARARHNAVVLRRLRYRRRHHARVDPALLRSLPNTRAGRAVRAALTQLGVPYVWGGTTPGKGLDCSGLTQYSYHEAGLNIGRDTYAQINDGIPVPRSQIQAGDLIFPHAGHVQLALNNHQVIEAPYSGATVRISNMPAGIWAIRRPIG